jgi:hypothetical protein
MMTTNDTLGKILCPMCRLYVNEKQCSICYRRKEPVCKHMACVNCQDRLKKANKEEDELNSRKKMLRF